MTHDILQTDIELAIRLMGEQRSAEQIIRALLNRGIDPAAAARLVDDLRSGRDVTAQSPLPQELHFRRRLRTPGKRAAPGALTLVRSGTPDPQTGPLDLQPRDHRGRSRPLARIAMGLAALALVALGFVLYQRYQNQAFAPAEPAASFYPADAAVVPGATSVAPTAQEPPPAPLLLELQPDGLRVAGKLATRETLLAVLAELLGSPTRTNEVVQTGVMIYAYDHHGLLVYAQPGGGTNSIVLDCDATGGVNGTTHPFAGSLKLEERFIRPDMNSEELTAIKALALQTPGGSGNVWNGRYHDLDLVFAYLKAPGHLSLIEIDLK